MTVAPELAIESEELDLTIPMSGRFFRIRPVEPRDVDALYEIALNPEVSYRWRYRGFHPTREKFEADLKAFIFCAMTVTSVKTDEVVGLLISYYQDPRNMHAYFGSLFDPKYLKRGVSIEAVLLFCNYLFSTWPFRKLYMEISEFNIELIGSGKGRNFEIEGRLKDHEFYKGRYWDKLTLAVYRPEHLGGAARPA
jgi:RimJ/RimL family protein N-acetyltransferase